MAIKSDKLILFSSLLVGLVFSLGLMNFVDASPCDTYQRDNGKTICVSESTATKLMERGWEITKIVKIVEDDPPAEVTNTESNNITNDKPETIILNLSSPVEFVDDDREIKRSTLQRAPAPWPMYDRIMNGMENKLKVGDPGIVDDMVITGVPVSAAGAATFTITPHEKYSLNPQQGLYLEDWLPTFIPDGQKLLYSESTYNTFELNKKQYESYSALYQFVPTTFVLHQNATTHDLQVSKGFVVNIEYNTLPFDEVEDNIEFLKESFAKQSGNYGGFVDMTRDGKTVLAYGGGNNYNHYRAGINFSPDENTSVGVSSNYHTLDELIPIFESIMK